MKILFLCNKSPYPHREGGPIAMNRMIEGMIALGHQVKVIGINSFKYHVDINDVPATYRKKTQLDLQHIDLRIKPLAAFLNLFTNKSYHVQRFISAPFGDKIKAALQQTHYDIVQMETLYLAPYVDLIRTTSPKSAIVLRAHNIEHLIWERVMDTTKNPLKKMYLRHLVKTLKQYEVNSLPKFDGVAAITDHDARFIRNYNSKTIAIPFGIYPEQYLVSKPEQWEYPSLFHLGSMNWIPNEEGIRWFLKEVWPAVHNDFPKLTLYLAGRHMPSWLSHLNQDGVKVLGEVNSAEKFMAQKGIMVVPLLSGSGIRIKIIEGMAAGKPIISTTTGAEGIEVKNGHDILIADTAAAFRQAIDKLIKDKTQAIHIAREARNTIEKKYNNTSLMKKLSQFYENI